MQNDVPWQHVSDCVHPKHGKGIVYLRLYVGNYTMLKYEYEDGYVEYFEINCLGRKKKSKYGFLKVFRGKFEQLPDSPLQTVQTGKYDRKVNNCAIVYKKKEAVV